MKEWIIDNRRIIRREKTCMCICIFTALILFIIIPCSAQLWPPYNLLFPFGLGVNPYIFASYAYCPMVSSLYPPVPSAPLPLLKPYPASLPTLGRSAMATIIIILPQATNPVTAYAPLGTVTLTPSVLVPLGLFLTLAE